MNESTDSMLTSAPPPFRRRTGAKARAIRIEPKKFVSISARAASTAPSANDAELRRMPALFTTMETSRQVRAAIAMSSPSVTSSGTAMRPWFVIVAGSRAAP